MTASTSTASNVRMPNTVPPATSTTATGAGSTGGIVTGGSVVVVVVVAGWPAATGAGLVDVVDVADVVDVVDVVDGVDGAAAVTVSSAPIDAGATVGVLGVGGDETAVPHPETRSSPATAPVSGRRARTRVGIMHVQSPEHRRPCRNDSQPVRPARFVSRPGTVPVPRRPELDDGARTTSLRGSVSCEAHRTLRRTNTRATHRVAHRTRFERGRRVATAVTRRDLDGCSVPPGVSRRGRPRRGFAGR